MAVGNYFLSKGSSFDGLFWIFTFNPSFFRPFHIKVLLGNPTANFFSFLESQTTSTIFLIKIKTKAMIIIIIIKKNMVVLRYTPIWLPELGLLQNPWQVNQLPFRKERKGKKKILSNSLKVNASEYYVVPS